MNQYKFNWSEEDLALEEEFQLEIELSRAAMPKAPKVPSKLDRFVRAQAQQQVSRDLEKQWLFKSPLQLFLAVLLLGTIGTAFLYSLSPAAQKPGIQLHHEILSENWEHQKLKGDFYLVSFKADPFGRAGGIHFVQACMRDKADQCTRSREVEDKIRSELQTEHHPKAGEQYRLIRVRKSLKEKKLKF